MTEVDMDVIYTESDVHKRFREFSREIITRDSDANMRCAHLPELDMVCMRIANIEHISVPRVYTTLNQIGYGILYSRKKKGIDIPLFDLNRLTTECVMKCDYVGVEYVMKKDDLFPLTTKEVMRFSEAHANRCVSDSEKYGISLSNLNLYYALQGLDEFIRHESFGNPDYTDVMKLDYFTNSISLIDRVDSRCALKCNILKNLLDIHII